MCGSVPTFTACTAPIVVQEGVAVGKGPQHAVRGFPGPLGLPAAKIVEPASGVGVDQGQRARLLLQGANQANQQAMLHDIGAVAVMERITIIHCNSGPYRLDYASNRPGCRSSQVMLSLYRLAAAVSFEACHRRVGCPQFYPQAIGA